MSFVEPFLLWGALAVIIPVAIHFWHQKQGTPLPWAATQWLTEKQQQQSRGLRLDNILLLVLRCLLLLLLVLLLAKPLLNWFTSPPPVRQVHLVQPSPGLADNFRFELTEALKKGEQVVWAGQPLDPVTAEITLPEKPEPFNPLLLQTAIDQLDTKNTALHLYITNSQALATVPAIIVPAQFHLHTAIDSTPPPRAYLAVKDNRKLFINGSGILTAGPALDPTLKFNPEPAHSGPIHTLLNYRHAQERQTVKAALAALTDVYGLELDIDEKSASDKPYDWVLTDQLPTQPAPQTQYIVSGQTPPSIQPNVMFTSGQLTPQTSDLAATGQLPEWLGTQLVQRYGLTTPAKPLRQRELNTLFVSTTKPATEHQAGIQQALLLLFVGLIILERWLALTKNA